MLAYFLLFKDNFLRMVKYIFEVSCDEGENFHGFLPVAMKAERCRDEDMTVKKTGMWS